MDGEGGGTGSLSFRISRACRDGEPGASEGFRPDMPLADDFTDAASDLSSGDSLSCEAVVCNVVAEARGLSSDRWPGILDLRELRSDLDDSFVSDLENEG